MKNNRGPFFVAKITRSANVVVCSLLLLLTPVLSAQSASPQPSPQASAAPQTAPASTNEQGIPPAPPLSKVNAGVPLLFISGFLSLGGGATFWTLGSRPDTSPSYEMMGLGAGLFALGTVLTILGFVEGKGTSDYIQVQPAYDPEGPKLVGIDELKDGSQPSPSPSASPSPAAQ